MAENKPETTEAPAVPSIEEETKPSRLEVLVTRFPRASKVVAITGGITALVGGAQIARTVKARKSHLTEAGDSAKEAFDHLSASVSPVDPEA